MFPENQFPAKRLSALPLVEAIHAGKIKGSDLHMLQSHSFSARRQPRSRRVEKLEFYVNIEFFLSETARYADIVLAGSLMEEDEGTTTNVEGRVIHHRKVV